MLRKVVLASLMVWMFAGEAAETLAQGDGSIRVAAVRYGGGGDWYQAHTPLPFFLRFIRENTMIDVSPEPDVVELSQDQLFSYPFIFISGHGNIVLTEFEIERLREYVARGGFLYIDDDYGLDPYIRRELQRVFPGEELVELPFNHPIYRQHFSFPGGLPKIHEHDGKPAQGFGIFVDNRLAVYYTYETNISDGWEPPELHPNPPEIRELAFQMGVNILMYALTN
jgi:hypothetical protein